MELFIFPGGRDPTHGLAFDQPPFALQKATIPAQVPVDPLKQQFDRLLPDARQISGDYG